MMQNTIIFSVLITAFSFSYGMKLITKNKDALHYLMKWLCIENHFKINQSGIREYNNHEQGVVSSFGRDLQALTCTNKFFNSYISDEKCAHKIVRMLSTHYMYLWDTCVTQNLNPKGGIFHAIEEKINNLFLIAAQPSKQFTKDDLNDAWYVNATIMRDVDWIKRVSPKPVKERNYPKFRNMVVTSKPYTLLSMAYQRAQIGKIQMLIAKGADVKHRINNALLVDIAKKRSTSKKRHINNKVTYFTIAQLLLANGADPDDYSSPKWPTPLMIAVYNNDQEYAYLLLKYNANPDLSTSAKNCQLQYPFFYREDFILKNVFALERGEPKGWFKEMVDKVKSND